MTTAMDLRISADADIKRLREMVQKLEEKNAVLKSSDSPRLGRREPLNQGTRYSGRMTSSPPLGRVAVKLNLDDVPLMNLSDVDSEEDDSWLYMSPVHPPTPAQKSVSPYKYLKGSIDYQTDLSRVRGSLMAKLESIAAQEESLSRHDYHEDASKDKSLFDRNKTYIVEENSRKHDYDDIESFDISGSNTYPVRRRGTPTGTPLKPPQTKLFKAWENLSFEDDMEDDPPLEEAPVVRRRAPKTTNTERQSIRFHDENESGAIRPRGRASQSFAMETQDDDDNLECSPVVRRRAPKAVAPRQSAAIMPDAEIPIATKVRRRGQPSPNFGANTSDGEDVEVDAAPIRRRGAARQSLPVAGSSAGSPHMAWQAEEEIDDPVAVRPRRRGAPQSRDDGDEELYDIQSPVIRRRGSPSPKPDENSVLTAVRRRGAAPAESQIRPRGSGLPTPQQALNKRGPSPRLRAPQDVEVRRRSLPQVPTSSLQYPSSSYADTMIQPRVSGSSTPPKTRIRSQSPAGTVTPRGSKLAPRRIPTARASNSYYNNENDENWREGCY